MLKRVGKDPILEVSALRQCPVAACPTVAGPHSVSQGRAASQQSQTDLHGEDTCHPGLSETKHSGLIK